MNKTNFTIFFVLEEVWSVFFFAKATCIDAKREMGESDRKTGRDEKRLWRSQRGKEKKEREIKKGREKYSERGIYRERNKKKIGKK